MRWRHPHTNGRGRAAVLLVWTVSILIGCAGASLPESSPELDALITRQAVYAERGASSADWSRLARQFLRLASGSLAPDQREAALFGAGISYIYAGTVVAAEGAIRAFEQLLAEFPHSSYRPQALYWCAQAYARSGRSDTAARLYQELVNRFPDTLYAWKAWNALAPPLRPVESTPQETSSSSAPESAPALPSVPQPGREQLGHQLGLEVRSVVIDPGHGGEDSGAPGPTPEKTLTLDIARRLQEILRRQGFRVLLTREEDRFVPLRERTAMAERWKADLFLSIHVNWAKRPTASGVETWIAAPAKDQEAAQLAARENVGAGELHQLPQLLGELLSGTKLEESRRLARAIQTAVVQRSGARDRGVKEAPFVVLLGLRVPSVLVEVGFLSNPEESARLLDPDYRQRIAEGIAEGVVRFLEERRRSQPRVPTL